MARLFFLFVIGFALAVPMPGSADPSDANKNSGANSTGVTSHDVPDQARGKTDHQGQQEQAGAKDLSPAPDHAPAPDQSAARNETDHGAPANEAARSGPASVLSADAAKAGVAANKPSRLPALRPSTALPSSVPSFSGERHRSANAAFIGGPAQAEKGAAALNGTGMSHRR